MKASELKAGAVILVDQQNIFVRNLQVQSPSSRSGNTLYKVSGRNIVNGQKFERSFKGEENLELVDFERRAVQLLFKETDSCTFMDNETFEQHSIALSTLSDELPYLTEGIEGIYVMLIEGQAMGIELPAMVVLEIIETSPAIKGASASARTKPATLNTGLVVQVPEYIPTGEKVKVNTQSGEFVSRA